jgi:hypothetical protein
MLFNLRIFHIINKGIAFSLLFRTVRFYNLHTLPYSVRVEAVLNVPRTQTFPTRIVADIAHTPIQTALPTKQSDISRRFPIPNPHPQIPSFTIRIDLALLPIPSPIRSLPFEETSPNVYMRITLQGDYHRPNEAQLSGKYKPGT